MAPKKNLKRLHSDEIDPRVMSRRAGKFVLDQIDPGAVYCPQCHDVFLIANHHERLEGPRGTTLQIIHSNSVDTTGDQYEKS